MYLFVQSGGTAASVAVDVFSEKFACPEHPEVSLPELEPRLFSFNSPHGACPACDGLGVRKSFDRDKLLKDPGKTLREGAPSATAEVK